jgi:tetratricopeptide (TPR) repeat protein
MILRLSSFAARCAIGFVAVLLGAALSYYSIRSARAEYQAELETLEGYERATQLEPENPLNWYLLGRYWQYNFVQPDALRAIRAYQTSLARDPRSANAWLDLGTAYESEGDLAKARESFLEAKRAYPLSAEISWRYGNFLLRQHELDPAFAEIRRAVEADPKRGAEAFSRCWHANPDLQMILNRVLPPSRDVYLGVIRDLVADKKTAEALEVWSRLESLHPQLVLRDVFPIVDSLIETAQWEAAWRVWEQAARFSQLPPLLDAPGSVAWDGSFESGVTGGGFAWSYRPEFEGVQASLDSREKHSGNQSLRLQFGGKRNVSFDNACIVAPVAPSVAYRFSAWVRTRALTTDQGVRFGLVPIGDPRARRSVTRDVRGSEPWTRIEMPWTAEKDVHGVRICVVRYASGKLDNGIQGAAWVDDVALVPENSGSAKP